MDFPKRSGECGHKAHPRAKPKVVDRKVTVVPESCPNGFGSLPFPSDSKWHTHVQIDLPEPGKVIVTEFKVGSSYCKDCKKYHSAAHSRVANSLYGPRLHSYVSYLKFGLGLTLGKIQKLLIEQYSLELSTGQISEIILRTGNKFEGAYSDLKTKLLDQSHLHVDETGWRVDGDNAWLWSFSNDEVSVYTIDPTRGQSVVEDVLGESFAGVLCSDFYGAYSKIESKKQKCWSHILRDAKNLNEKNPQNEEILYFKSKLKSFFDRGKILRQERVEGKNIQRKLDRLMSDTANFVHRKFKNSDLQTLAKRMIKYRSEMYTFIEHNLEPTNNSADREVRPAVLMRKTSYGNRSKNGSESQAALMSMIRTAHKKGQNFCKMATEHLSRP